MVDLGAATQRARLAGYLRPGVHEHPAAAAPLLRNLGRFAELTSAEIEQVCELVSRRTRSRAGSILLGEGRAATPQFVLSGWACSQRVLRDGRRQIFDVIVPGEGFGLRPAEGRARCTVVAITAVETVDATRLLEIARGDDQGGLAAAVQAAIREEDLRRMEHLVRLGRLTAYEKAAHFILEVRRRLGADGAASFALPLTQEVIADNLGLSVVHLNRVLRQLRSAKYFGLRNGVATVFDEKALALAAVLPLPSEERADH